MGPSTLRITKPILALPAVLGPLAGGCHSSIPTDADRTATYAVYAALLRETVLAEGWAGDPKHYEDRRPIEHLVILGETDPEAPTEVSSYAESSLPSLESAAAADFEAKSRGQRLERRLEGVGPYVLLPESEATALFEHGWEGFYERYPDAPGLVAFSPVGFGRGGTQALVYMMHLRAGEWGHGTVYLLGKEETGWRILERVEVWEA